MSHCHCFQHCLNVEANQYHMATNTEVSTADMEIQTDETTVSISELERDRFLASVQQLTTNESSLQSSAKVKFYTGLPSFATLKAVFDFVAPYMREHRLSSLTLFLYGVNEASLEC